MINKIGSTPSFQSKVLISDYDKFSDNQRKMAHSPEFLKAYKELSQNGDDNLVNIVASKDGDDLTMNVVKKTDHKETTIAYDWLYSDNTREDIIQKYYEMVRDEAIWDKRYHTKGNFTRVSGEIADYLA